MNLSKHYLSIGTRWALNGSWLPESFNFAYLLTLKKEDLFDYLGSLPTEAKAEEPLSPPIDSHQEVWACGVTYLRSREARMEESDVADVYERVYDAERPEIFFKGLGWRCRGEGEAIRIRRDSSWDVPEPELTLVVNAHGEIVGYTAGNDVSSRSIEGENPLYLPQAKTYDGSCAIGGTLILAPTLDLSSLPIELTITRAGETVFSGEASTSQMKRSPAELANWLFREQAFPNGVLLMTGTCLVPEDEFTLQVGDVVSVKVGEIGLSNTVA